ncbi:Polyadenylate-binding protein RBP47B' [Sesamum angolense]|uniref:Polyadenylate-binding protein RBP47B n=1 Tax=Sesamum angolense TaxID=2727404 RepID=A0AAE1TC27_9LAMI|nr:Polyadenylate-binding protein RBP47B' [Sesamum angolense]
MSSQTVPYHQPATLEEVRTLWIGDLPYWADENYLRGWFSHTGEETFRASYPSVRGAKVVTDPNTGRSKGYGFVKFADEMERNRAMVEMNGVYCSTRPMRISAATPKKTATGVQQQYGAAKAIYPPPVYTTPVQTVPVDNDINNTTVFIGNLDPNVTEEELRQIFLQFGDIVYVKIPAAKGCGFVQFAARSKSIDAYYAYGQGYDAYAYGASQDPSAYAYGAYAGYVQYPHQEFKLEPNASILGLN